MPFHHPESRSGYLDSHHICAPIVRPLCLRKCHLTLAKRQPDSTATIAPPDCYLGFPRHLVPVRENTEQMRGATDNRAAQMSLDLTLSRRTGEGTRHRANRDPFTPFKQKSAS